MTDHLSKRKYYSISTFLIKDGEVEQYLAVFFF